MSSSSARFIKYLRVRAPSRTFCAPGVQISSKMWYSTTSFNKGGHVADVDDNGGTGVNNAYPEDDVFIPYKQDIEPQGVDPKRGWGFRGVHKAIICGKIGQAPVQKILRNGKTVTIFTVGTGGMYDQRIVKADHLPKPAQWHRIAVHNEQLGAYAVQQLVKNSPVYVEGDIETRVYNDSISGEVKNIPEICVRRDGKVRLIKTGENVSNISLDDLRGELF
ncbi:PREDICTED: single-stranded DNA-binding protein, mitochondrial-like [Nelumbo nucifera]|uniref:Single-stranded DNA-binding protein, mitochondrial-like n=2 Tax=Nelumbo nucifera TaxID=4432 RepID=A0A1U7YXZ0_NELNU|nr:PREDICTED: single-stranded DNA-binding protein, mitochondrial-like [Nelumbo nucifera]DAD33205.1 TPA_asm: hypothetical protein HUJ06_012056 [Nelumbo nucifera]